MRSSPLIPRSKNFSEWKANDSPASDDLTILDGFGERPDPSDIGLSKFLNDHVEPYAGFVHLPFLEIEGLFVAWATSPCFEIKNMDW